MSLLTGEDEAAIDDRQLVGERTEPDGLPTLPDEPLVRIRPSRGWDAINLKDLWHYRDLLYILATRDIKVRYKQTMLGAAWAILQPLLTMVIFTVFFGKLAGVPSDNIPYPIFAYAGLLPWTFFADLSNSIKDPTLRFFGMEHELAMLAATILVHIGRVQSKHATTESLRHRRVWTTTLLALLIITAAIPWPGFQHGRPLLRMLKAPHTAQPMASPLFAETLD
jgi:hypothetical protein